MLSKFKHHMTILIGYTKTSNHPHSLPLTPPPPPFHPHPHKIYLHYPHLPPFINKKCSLNPSHAKYTSIHLYPRPLTYEECLSTSSTQNILLLIPTNPLHTHKNAQSPHIYSEYTHLHSPIKISIHSTHPIYTFTYPQPPPSTRKIVQPPPHTQNIPPPTLTCP